MPSFYGITSDFRKTIVKINFNSLKTFVPLVIIIQLLLELLDTIHSLS